MFYVLLIHLRRQVSREYDLHMNNPWQDLSMSQIINEGSFQVEKPAEEASAEEKQKLVNGHDNDSETAV